MLCMGDDDRSYRNESSVEIHHSHLPVKSAKHRLRGYALDSQLPMMKRVVKQK